MLSLLSRHIYMGYLVFMDAFDIIVTVALHHFYLLLRTQLTCIGHKGYSELSRTARILGQ